MTKYNFANFKNEAKKAEEWLAKEYSTIHSGRATPHVLDGVLVESYGSKTPVSHVASISMEDPKSLMVSPWDKNLMKEIERSIQAANLGLSVSAQTNGVRVSFPELTVERKKTLIKVVKDKLEDARVSVRGEREKVWNDIQAKEREGQISEDDKFNLKDELQKITDETNKNLEETAGRKEKEIMA